MILTVTLNAALDLTYEAETLRWGEVNRVEQVHARAGGKGINVARTLQQLGVEALVTGLAGGLSGEAIRADLAASRLRDALLPMAAESRRTVTAVSRADGAVTALNEPGPEVAPHEWERLVAALPELLGGADAAVLSGSVPRGVPDDCYARLARVCARCGVPAVVDASGDALLQAAAAGPSLVKPNLQELEEIAGPGPEDPVEAALRGASLLRGRGAQAVVVSLGERGMCAIAPEGAWHAATERVPGNPVGAGDAAVAALAAGALAGAPWPERLGAAAATAAAAVAYPHAGGYDPPTRSRLLSAVVVERLNRPLAGPAGAGSGQRPPFTQ